MKTSKFFFAAMMVAAVAVGFTACDPEDNGGDIFGGGDNNGGDNGNGGGDTPTECLTVAQAIAKQDGSEATVKGHIVGWYNVKPNPGVCVFSAEAAADTSVNKANVLIADAADCKDAAQVLCVQLPGGAVRSLVNLGENAGNLGKVVTIKGNLTKYNNLPGLKECSYAEIDGQKSTDPQNLLCYRTKDGVVSGENLKVGDVVVLKTVLINFKGTLETNYGYFTAINGTVPAEAISASKALEIAAALEQTTDPKQPIASDSVLVTGTVSKITDPWTSKYKNVTYNIK